MSLSSGKSNQNSESSSLLTTSLDEPRHSSQNALEMFSPQDIQQLSLSPAGLAMLTSYGRWRMARHLDRINQTMLKVLGSIAVPRNQRGDGHRVMVFAPPRHGKSDMISLYTPACAIGCVPRSRVILTSYSASKAAQNGRAVRNFLEEWGEAIYGIRICDATSAKNDWEVERFGGGMVTAGAEGGGIMGRGADLFIIDDPIQGVQDASSDTIQETLWQWFQSTAKTRVEPGGAMVLTMQRWLDTDLAGRILSEQGRVEEGGRWEVISFPAIAEEDEFDEQGELWRHAGDALWPEQWSAERLIREHRTGVDDFWWFSQYQQKPGSLATSEWPAEYFDGDDLWFNEWPDDIIFRVLALDPSKGVKGDRPAKGRQPDYSAIIRLGISRRGLAYVEADMDRYRDSNKIVDDMARHYCEFQPDALIIEGNSFQELFGSLLEAKFRSLGINAEVLLKNHAIKKEIRIRKLAPYLKAREFRFMRPCRGTMELIDQMRRFPSAANDDGPDCLQMAMEVTEEMMVDRSDGLGDRLRGVNIR